MSIVSAQKRKQSIPTYIPKQAHDLPMFFENKPYQGASGRIYPIPYCDGITDEKADVDYEVYTLENEYIQTQIAPALGGKILRGLDKLGNYDFIYYNEVVKPALVGIAGPWISGGIEFNWPQHHRPTTFLPLEAVLEENADGSKTVWTGEAEPMNHMKGMVGITVEPGRSYIKAKVRLYNRTSQPQLFMWWANLAVPVNDDYRTVFPPDCEWVNDHDRRAVLEWPIAKGVYKTARPYDYGKGTDISHYSAVKVPSSYLISQGQSDMDFIAGYDTGRKKGIATVANHQIAPGKKMWHWGTGDFGDMWCSNLTDANGPYIELMTGVFTDNQPDFTWIAPYESKEFCQFWYPIRDIGEPKNATIDAAMNMEQREDELLFGFHVTGSFPNAVVRAETGDKLLYTETVSLTPAEPYLKTIPLNGVAFENVKVSLTAEDGRELVSYTPYCRGQKGPIDVREPVKRPREIASVEEMYINGLHLEQYKQHNYRPEPYYLEGLRRDPGDIRCNTSMGRLCLRSGEFARCVEYCDTAIRRLTSRNQHPADTEAIYLKGLALTYLGREREAYDTLYRAAWNYAHRSAAMFQLACLDCRKGEMKAAMEKLRESLGLNRGHTVARNLMAAILRHLGDPKAEEMAQENRDEDLLDLFAIVELSFHQDCAGALSQFQAKPDSFLDVAADYMQAGFYDDALHALSFAGDGSPLTVYYRAYCLHMLGQDAAEMVRQADAMNTGFCFPNRLEDIAVLHYAAQCWPKGANAHYYLGCLYYDRFRYQDAAQEWETCVAKAPTHGKAWRNLALYYFDKAGDAARARQAMEKALVYKTDDPRVLMEYQQLLKNINCTVQERLAVYDRYPELMTQRDDSYLDYLTLIAQTGEFQKAIDLAAARRFHIYEGGEGKLTKQHAWMHVLYGKALMEQGNLQKAEEILEKGVNMPKSYGEAKTFFNQEAHIYYYLGLLHTLSGSTETAQRDYETAAVYKAAVSEISMFRVLALKKLGRAGEAQAVAKEMLAAAENLIVNKDLRSYYGVGSPSPMPFEYDIEKKNLTDGHILKAFALLGLGDDQGAEAAMETARALDPWDFRIFAFDRVKQGS